MSRYGYATDGRALRMCSDCGCMVGNTFLHDKHHEDTDAMTLLNVTTATNLLATVNALIDSGIGVEVNVSEIPG